MKSLHKTLAVALLALIIFISVMGPEAVAAEDSGQEPVTIQLRWTHQFQFAGYYAAVEKGFYAAEGLDVSPRAAVPGQDRVAPVLEGRAQYGVGDAGILKLRADGKPVVLLAQIFQHSPSILMTKRESNIFSPYELKGKTVLLNQDYAGSAAVRAMILETLGGLDQVTIIPRHYADEEFTGGKADAVAGYLSNEPYRMKQAGLAINIIDPRSYGIDFYGDNLYTTEAEIAAHPERAEKMRRATLKGWAFALNNREEIIDLILDRYNSALDREQLRFEAKVIDQMVLADIIPIGETNPRRYERIAEILHRLGISPSPEIPEGFLYRQRPEAAVRLSAEERAWLAAHPRIVLGTDENWAPDVIVNADGSLTGIDVDMLQLLNKKLGTNIELRLGRWVDMVAMAQAREIDGLATSADVEKFKPHFLVSKSYLTGYKCIFTRTKEDFGINGLQDLEGHRVAIYRGNVFSRNLLKGIPRVEIVEAEGLHALMELLLKGQVDAIVESANLFYEMFSKRIGGIKLQKIIADRPLYLVYSIRRDWPQFVSIINKGLDAISEAEMSQILKKYAMDMLPQVKPSFVLNDREKAWLAEEHTVRVGVSDLPPFIFAQKGQRPTGIAIDILDLIARGTGLDLRYDDSPHPWDEAIQIMSSPGGPDLIPWMGIGSKTRGALLLSKPLMHAPLVIIAEQNALPVHGIQNLFGRIVSVSKLPPLHDMIVQNYPQIRLSIFETEAEAMNEVNLGRTDAYIGNLSVASHIISRNGWTNLKVAGPSGLEDSVMSFGVRQDLPVLRSIINKGLDAISEEALGAIHKKHLAVRYEHGVSREDIFKWIFVTGGASGIMIFLFVYWNRSLQKRVRNRTLELDTTNETLQTEIRERGNAEQKVRESRDYIRNLTNSLPDVVVSVTLPDRKIAWVNDAVKVLEYKPEECIGMSTRVFFPTQEDHLAFGDKLTRAIEEGQDVLMAELILKKKSGELFAAEVRISFFRVNGTVVSETVVLRDITESQKTASERNQLRNELAHLSRVMTMSELSASLAHEINQPLGAIQNNAAAARILLSMPKEDHAEFDEILTDIAGDAMRASQIIRTVRGIVRKEEEEFEPLNLNVLIEEVVELFRNAFNRENISIILDLHPDLAPVKGNRVRLQQVLTNLVSNASDAMRESPSKRLSILSTTQSTDLIVASVSDSGKGIDETMKGKIFQPFFTTKKDGLGVGLRICRSIIDEHGGRIWVENNPAGGATFSFSLKAYQGGSE